MKKEEVKQLLQEIWENEKEPEQISKIAFYEQMVLQAPNQIGIEQDIILKERQIEDEKGKKHTYIELYDASMQKVGIFKENGKFSFDLDYLEQLKEKANETTIPIHELEVGEITLPEVLEKNKDNKKLEMTKEQYQEQKREEQEREEQKIEEFAEEKGIPTTNCVAVRENSTFYKNYPNMAREEPDLIFYRDNASGTIKAEYRDPETGKFEPSKYIEESRTELVPVVSMGKDGEKIEKVQPYQVMYARDLAKKNENLQDFRFTADFKQGYLSIGEARQGSNGEWISHEVEVEGREYNSPEITEKMQNITKSQDPSELTKKVDRIEDTGFADDGIQIDELQDPEKILQGFMEEGYIREEAIDILNYILEDQLSEEQAKEQVNEEIQSRNEDQDLQKEYEENEAQREEELEENIKEHLL